MNSFAYPVVRTKSNPAPRTILIAKIIKIIKILKGLVACGEDYGGVYEECAEYGEEYKEYVECTQYVKCMAMPSLVLACHQYITYVPT